MYLAADAIIPYLLQRGILRPDLLLSSQWVVSQSSLKRPVFRVSRRDGTGWVVKQASPLDLSHVRMLDREAAFYGLPDACDWAKPLKGLMPRMRAYDRGVHALVVQWVPHDTAWNSLRRERADATRVGSLLGDALGRIHLELPRSRSRPLFLTAKLPWVLQLNSVATNDLEEAGLRTLLEMIRAQPALSSALVDLARSWRVDTLVHGDAKLDNVLVRLSAPRRTWFIDWAFAGEGDPAWDLGSVMQSAVLLWLHGVQFLKDEDFAASIARSVLPLTLVQTFVRSMLERYRRTRGVSVREWRALSQRATTCCAAALVQSALAEARTQVRYSPRQLAMLQLAQSIFVDPQDALQGMFDAA